MEDINLYMYPVRTRNTKEEKNPKNHNLGHHSKISGKERENVLNKLRKKRFKLCWNICVPINNCIKQSA